MFYLIILLVGLTVAVVNYIFRGIGMYNMAKREGMDYPWLAFVPFARTYLQGELGGTVHLKNKQIKNFFHRYRYPVCGHMGSAWIWCGFLILRRL